MILSNGSDLSVEPERLHLNINKIEVIENPICPCNNSAVVNRLMHKGFSVSVENIPEDKVKSMIANIGAPMNHQHNDTTVGDMGAPHINHQNMK